MGTRHEGCRRGEMHEIPDTRREGGGTYRPGLGGKIDYEAVENKRGKNKK